MSVAAQHPGGSERTRESASLDRRLVFAAVAERLQVGVAAPVTIGRFVVLERVGAGCFGTVYAAFDPRLRRKIALKLVDGPGGAEARARIEHEARAAAGLTHPNVVTIHDVGELDGRIYIAMEFVEGTTLGGWWRAQARGWREIVRMFVAVGRGLQAAHDAGVVHRDLKPDNVLVGRDGRPRIADFGLARSAAAPATDASSPAISSSVAVASTVVGSGAIAGTPAYMAPEQFVGRGVGPASDQFALCVALYEALFGRRPFAGGSVVALAEAVRQARILPTSRRAIPRAIERAIRRGLAADPGERFASVAALCEALERALARRRKLLGLVFGAGALSLAATAGAGLRPTAPSPCAAAGDEIADTWGPARRDAIDALRGSDARWPSARAGLDRWAESWRDARHDACAAAHERGEQSLEAMDARVACLERRRTGVTALVEALAAGALDGAAAEGLLIEAAAGLPACSDPAALAEISANRWAHTSDRARDLANEALWRDSLDALARVHVDAAIGRGEQARGEARAIAMQAAGAGLRAVEAAAWLEVGHAGVNLGEPDDAAEAYERAVALALASASNDVAVDALIGRVQTSVMRERISGEDDVRLATAAALLQRLGDDDARRSRLLEIEALVAESRGDLVTADAHMQAALAAGRAAYPAGARNLAVLANNTAQLAMQRGDHSRAAALWSELVAGAGADDGPDALAFAHNLALTELRRGRFAAAQRSLAVVRARRMRTIGAWHPSIASTLSAEAEAWRGQGHPVLARQLQLEALVMREALLGPDSPALATPLTRLARIELAQGDRGGARRRIERALVLRSAALGSSHPDLGEPLAVRAAIELAEGHAEVALADAARSIALQVGHGADPGELSEAHTVLVSAGAALARCARDPRAPPRRCPADRGSTRPSDRTPRSSTPAAPATRPARGA